MGSEENKEEKMYMSTQEKIEWNQIFMFVCVCVIILKSM